MEVEQRVRGEEWKEEGAEEVTEGRTKAIMERNVPCTGILPASACRVNVGGGGGWLES